MRGHAIKWTDKELAFVKAHSTLPRRKLLAAFRKEFGRKDISLSNISALCKRRGWLTGRDGRFVKGGVPHNKGKRMPFNQNSARHWFRKGHRPHNTKAVGHERLTEDGYVMVSIPKKNPHTGFERRYVLKHRYLWEQRHGPIPKGHCLKCRDGNRQNCDPGNWELIPRGVLSRISGKSRRDYDNAPDIIKPAIMATARLEQAIYERENDK